MKLQKKHQVESNLLHRVSLENTTLSATHKIMRPDTCASLMAMLYKAG